MHQSTQSLPILRITDTLATYMNAKFQSLIHKELVEVPFPRELSVQVVIDCDLAATVIAEAYKNRGKKEINLFEHLAYMYPSIVSTSWRVEDYTAELTTRSTGRNVVVEARLAQQFPPIHNPIKEYSDPLLLTDVEGKSFTWYLPGALSTTRKVSIHTNRAIPGFQLTLYRP